MNGENDVDEFGDSYTQCVTVQQLRELVYRSPDFSWRSALEDMIIFSQDLALPILGIAKLYGATVTDDKDNSAVTHHFVDTLDTLDSNFKSKLQGHHGCFLTKRELADKLRPHISPETYSALCAAI
ncbi:hypothetical protein ACHWQZ_G004569 [Mnemiopsis leidyi]